MLWPRPGDHFWGACQSHPCGIWDSRLISDYKSTIVLLTIKPVQTVVFEHSGKVFDPFFGRARPRGLYLVRAEYVGFWKHRPVPVGGLIIWNPAHSFASKMQFWSLSGIIQDNRSVDCINRWQTVDNSKQMTINVLLKWINTSTTYKSNSHSNSI